jgi:hypothetical protein
MIFLASLLAAVLFLFAICLSGLNALFPFGDPIAALFLFAGLAGYMLLFGRKEFRRGVKTFFAFSFPPDEHSLESGRFFLRFAKFTVRWGLLGMIIGILMMMADLDPETIGIALAVSLLSFFYAAGLAVFVLLPISLRLSPPELKPVTWKPAVHLALAGLALFFLTRFIFVLLLFSVQEHRTGHIQPGEIVTAAKQAAFVFNPADPAGRLFPRFDKVEKYYVPENGALVEKSRSLSFFGKICIYILQWLFLFWDMPCIILVVGSWWAFRLAAGKCRGVLAASVIIWIGLLGTIMGLILTFSDVDPELLDLCFLLCMLTTFYAFLAAACFLLSDMCRRSGDCGVRLSPASCEGIEEAKEIIDNVVARERR